MDIPFKVGDAVRLKATVERPSHGWGGVKRGSVGIVIGIREKCLWIDFPGQKGWCGEASEMEKVEFSRFYQRIAPWDGEQQINVIEKNMPITRQTILTVEARRDGLELILDLKADAELEKFIQHTVGGEKTTSERWKDNTGKPLEFYQQNEQYKKVFTRFYRESYDDNVFDDFGSDLLRGTIPNVAPLRIVGLSNGVSFRVTNLVSFAELRQYIERLAAVVRMIYREFIRRDSVKIMLTLDV